MPEFHPPKTGAFGQSAASLIAQLELALDHYERCVVHLPGQKRHVGDLALRIACRETVAALPVLVRYLHLTQDSQPLQRLLSASSQPLQALSLAQLLQLVPLLCSLHSNLAVLTATALVEKAERERTREFAEALPLLKAGLANPSAPMEFVGLRKRLVEALKGHNFPLPAETVADATDLPLPSQKKAP